MTTRTQRLGWAIAAGLIAVWGTAASAAGFPSTDGSAFGFTPRVPVSALARPAAWFDPSRLRLSTSLSFGSGFSGGAQGLQVTSLSYRFKAPVWMSVNVGNTWGPSARGNSSMFLEGLDLGMRPFGNFLFEVHYRDVRSPLQYGYDRPFFDRSYYDRPYYLRGE